MNKQHLALIRAHFAAIDPVIAPVVMSVKYDVWFSKIDKDDYFLKLCKEIVGQQLSGKVVDVIWGRVLQLLPAKTITPAHILAVEDQAYRDAGMSWAKVKYIKDLAQKVLSGDVVLEKLPEPNDNRVVEELTKVKGIGKWTAEMFLMFSLGREDVFSHGDLGLRRGLEKLYGLQDPNQDDIEVIVSKWSPYRSYGSVALWHSLEPKSN